MFFYQFAQPLQIESKVLNLYFQLLNSFVLAILRDRGLYLKFNILRNTFAFLIDRFFETGLEWTIGRSVTMKLFAAGIGTKLLNCEFWLKRPVVIQTASRRELLFFAAALAVAFLEGVWHGDHQKRIRLVHELQ